MLCLLSQQNINPKKKRINQTQFFSCTIIINNKQRLNASISDSSLNTKVGRNQLSNLWRILKLVCPASQQIITQKRNTISQNINQHDQSSTAEFECIQIKYQSRSGPTEQLLWRILMELRFVLLLNGEDNENNSKRCISEKDWWSMASLNLKEDIYLKHNEEKKERKKCATFVECWWNWSLLHF